MVRPPRLGVPARHESAAARVAGGVTPGRRDGAGAGGAPGTAAGSPANSVEGADPRQIRPSARGHVFLFAVACPPDCGWVGGIRIGARNTAVLRGISVRQAESAADGRRNRRHGWRAGNGPRATRLRKAATVPQTCLRRRNARRRHVWGCGNVQRGQRRSGASPGARRPARGSGADRRSEGRMPRRTEWRLGRAPWERRRGPRSHAPRRMRHPREAGEPAPILSLNCGRRRRKAISRSGAAPGDGGGMADWIAQRPLRRLQARGGLLLDGEDADRDGAEKTHDDRPSSMAERMPLILLLSN